MRSLQSSKAEVVYRELVQGPNRADESSHDAMMTLFSTLNKVPEMRKYAQKLMDSVPVAKRTERTHQSLIRWAISPNGGSCVLYLNTVRHLTLSNHFCRTFVQSFLFEWTYG